MHKLSELMGQNERQKGSILFSFDVAIDGGDDSDIEAIQRILAKQISAAQALLPRCATLGTFQLEDVDLIIEDDYDRLGSINCDL